MRCNCPIDDRTCRIDRKLFHLTNRTNRSNRQHFHRVAVVTNEMQLSDRRPHLSIFHLTNRTNRTNRSNRQHFVHFSLIKWNFSDRQQIECCFVGWTLCDSIGHECTGWAAWFRFRCSICLRFGYASYFGCSSSVVQL